ncbi:hypothetical protein, partial [Treponema sp. UBA785]|uniref:hypothetical protein n=1 Tax=Treponema sp. UBA785 TaxID=1947757 RepID=UPI0025CB8B0F
FYKSACFWQVKRLSGQLFVYSGLVLLRDKVAVEKIFGYCRRQMASLADTLYSLKQILMRAIFKRVHPATPFPTRIKFHHHLMIMPFFFD